MRAAPRADYYDNLAVLVVDDDSRTSRGQLLRGLLFLRRHRHEGRLVHTQPEGYRVCS